MRVFDFYIFLASFLCQEQITIFSGQGSLPGANQNIIWARSPARSMSQYTLGKVPCQEHIRINSGHVCPAAAWPLSWQRARSPISAVQVEASERLGLCAPQASLITLGTSLGKFFSGNPSGKGYKKTPLNL